MSQYNDEELMHYGIPGMKWGRRRAQRYERTANKINSTIRAKQAKGKKLTARDGIYLAKAAHLKSKANDLNSDKKVTLRESNKNAKNARREAIRSAKLSNMSPGQARVAKAKEDYKQVKKERKTALKNTYKKINKETGIGEKLLYNNATRKKAAKYVVDNNMSISDAKKKANKVAIRNTAIIVGGALGAVAISKLKKR